MVASNHDNRNYERLSMAEEGVDSIEKPNPGVIKSSVFYAIGLFFVAAMINIIVDDVIYLRDPMSLNQTIKHSRAKRFVYMNSERRLRWPPGTILDLESTLSLPGLSPMPTGLGSETAISIPFDVDFDTLGLTSEDNTFGNIPMMERMTKFMGRLRNWRNWTQIAEEEILTSGGGGERFLIYQNVERAMNQFGIDGKTCFLRFLCEFHDSGVFGWGMFGEFLDTIFTASSSSSYLDRLVDYLEAEKQGKSDRGCYQYEHKCPLSLFNPFSKEDEHKEDEIRHNFLKNHPEHSNEFGSLQEYKQRKKEVMEEKKSRKSKKPQMKVLSREKRQLFFGPAGNLMLPVGTVYIIKPQLKLPYMRNLPTGYKSGMSIGIPLRYIFDDLGLTSILNPFLNFPFLANLFRKKRDTWQPIPGVNYAAGDREVLYPILEHFIEFSYDNGKDCLLKAICQTHLSPLSNYGIFGDFLTRFLSPSQAPHADLRLQEYLEAEYYGKNLKYCKNYEDQCDFSLYTTEEEIEMKKLEKKSQLYDANHIELVNNIKETFMM